MLSWDEFDKEDEVDLNAVKPALTVVEMSLDKLDKDGQTAAIEARAVQQDEKRFVVHGASVPCHWADATETGLLQKRQSRQKAQRPSNMLCAFCMRRPCPKRRSTATALTPNARSPSPPA